MSEINPSGFYNCLCGRNPLMPIILGLIGIFEHNYDEYPLGRLRDVTVSKDGKQVYVFTRNGDLPAIDEGLKKHPQYVDCFRDEADNYVTYIFNVPQWHEVSEESCITHNLPPGFKVDQWEQTLRRIVPTSSYDPGERLKKVSKAFGSGDLDPIPDHIQEFNDSMQTAMKAAIATGEPQVAGNRHGNVRIVPLDNGKIAIIDIDGDLELFLKRARKVQ